MRRVAHGARETHAPDRFRASEYWLSPWKVRALPPGLSALCVLTELFVRTVPWVQNRTSLSPECAGQEARLFVAGSSLALSRCVYRLALGVGDHHRLLELGRGRGV